MKVDNDITKSLENYLNAIDPCNFCDNRKNGIHTKPCFECGFYYPSKFKPIKSVHDYAADKK